jgi:hypothetical protein
VSVSAEQLRSWASRIRAGSADDIMDVAEEMCAVADDRDLIPHDDLIDAPRLPAGLFTYHPYPYFVSASRWPDTEYRRPWYVLGPADMLQGHESVDIVRHDGTTASVSPDQVVGWRVVRKKKQGPVLYVLMTFDRIDETSEDEDISPEWTLS